MTHTTLSTADLFTNTRLALCEGDWSTARKGLEQLATRKDFDGFMMPLSRFPLASQLNSHFSNLLTDRIDAVNSRAEDNALDLEA